MLVRLNKFIAESGVASRRKAEEFILQGRVSVNKKVVTDLSFRVSENDDVFVDGEKIRQRRYVYYLLNKPPGVVTTTNDEKKRKTVIDLINTSEKIFPVGRLDYNTTGVLLLTNDGNFSNILTHPRNRSERVYEVSLDRRLEDDDKSALLKGVYIEGKKGVFTKLEFPKTKDRKKVLATCIEGRNRFVKRMFAALGYTVTVLNRKSFAGIESDIPVGNYRMLTSAEIKKILKIYGS